MVVAAVTTDFPVGFRNAVHSTTVGYPSPKDRCYMTLPPLICTQLGTYNNNLPNLSQAVERRVYTVADGAGGFKECPKPTTTFDYSFCKEVATHYTGRRERLTSDEFLSHCPRHSRKAYQRAVLQNAIAGCNRAHAWIFPFVKNEKVDVSKACRLISPRHKRFNVELGRYTRAVEDDMYRALGRAWGDDEGTENTIAKGMTVAQIGSAISQKWHAFNNPVAVGLDASRFDQHVSRQCLHWEHQFYKELFPDDGYLEFLLRQQLNNTFVVRSGDDQYKFCVDGTRMSGDMNTALGNCIIMSSLVLLYCRTVGVSAKLINNGDDCVVFMEASDLQRFSSHLAEWFLARGFEMKVEEPVYELEHIEFCQMHPIRVGTEVVMCRNVVSAFSKDVMSLGSRDLSSYRNWLHAVGQCGMSLYGDMPLYQSLYRFMLREGTHSRLDQSAELYNSGFMRLGKVPRCRLGTDYAIRPATRLSFQLAFGITVREQLEIEAYLDAAVLAQSCAAMQSSPGLALLARGKSL